MATGDVSECFLVSTNGQIESAEFPGFDYIWCRYCFEYGKDWNVVAGVEEAHTQTALKTPDERSLHIFNFPIDITFKSCYPSGWPQIIIYAYGVDVFGQDVIRGYGACHVPMQPGKHVRKIAMFVPESSQGLAKFNAWLLGKRPEFVNPRVVATGESRDVTKVRTQGFVTLSFNVVLKNMRKLGYEFVSQNAIISSE